MNYKLTMLLIGTAPLIAIIVYVAGKRLKKLAAKIQTAMGDVTHIASEAVDGHVEIKSFNAQDYENSRAARTAQDTAATAEYLRREYPNAVQCPRCRAGPVIPENCYDLQAHHGEALPPGRGRISNACPSCGFFSRDRNDWVRWDCQLPSREGERGRK